LLKNILSPHVTDHPNSKIVFLSGWGQRSNILNLNDKFNGVEYLDYLPFSSIELTFSQLQLQNPDITIGWSLGGQIAINAILNNVITPKLLILLATPFQFLSDNYYKIGVDPKIYNNFCDNLSKDPEKLLKRFHLMMLQGDKRFLEFKSKYFYHNNFNNLRYWLDYLVDFSAAKYDFSNFCKTELIYGKNDKIVNYKQGQLFHKYIANSNFNVVDNYSHILF